MRGEATFGVVSARPLDVTRPYVEECVARAGMRTVHRHERDRLLYDPRDAGVLRGSNYDLIDPPFARQLIALDPRLIHVLPWHVCVRADGDGTTVTTAMPSVVITEFTHEAEVGRLARRFESALQVVLRDVAARAGRSA